MSRHQSNTHLFTKLNLIYYLPASIWWTISSSIQSLCFWWFDHWLFFSHRCSLGRFAFAQRPNQSDLQQFHLLPLTLSSYLGHSIGCRWPVPLLTNGDLWLRSSSNDSYLWKLALYLLSAPPCPRAAILPFYVSCCSMLSKHCSSFPLSSLTCQSQSVNYYPWCWRKFCPSQTRCCFFLLSKY